MDTNTQLLLEISRSARMGKEAAQMLSDKVRSQDMRSEILQRKSEYENLEQAADDMLSDAGTQPEQTSAMGKAGLWMGLTMNTLTNQSDSHIAEIMMQGSGMGVIEMTKSLKRFPDAQQGAKDLAERFLAMEEGGIQRMKAFL